MNLSKRNDENVPPMRADILIDSIYADAPVAKRILLEHSEAVAKKALSLNAKLSLGLDENQIYCAAMLHDIGIIRTNAPGIGCHGDMPYICHGYLGADILRARKAPEWAARVAEGHTGVGITPDDIIRQNLPLPSDRILYPQTLLEKLICYADKFFSKKPGELSTEKTIEQISREMARFGESNLKAFQLLDALFRPTVR